MKNLFLLAIALAIAFVIFMPLATFASSSKSIHGNSQKVQHLTVSKVQGRDGNTRNRAEKSVAAAKAASRLCFKECVNGANKKIVKSTAAKCGKAFGKRNKTQCQACGKSDKSENKGIGHQINTHRYNGVGLGHCKHNCANCTTKRKVKEGIGGGIAETFVPKANAQSAEAGSYQQPAALPEAGASVLLQIIAFFSSLFGAWGIRKVI